MSKAGERLMKAAQEMLGAREGDPGWEPFETSGRWEARVRGDKICCVFVSPAGLPRHDQN